MFKVEAMLQPFAGLLDAPTVMVKIAKQLGGEFGAFQQVGHEHADRARGSDMANETDLDRIGGTAVIADIGIIRGREGICPRVSNAANHRHG